MYFLDCACRFKDSANRDPGLGYLGVIAGTSRRHCKTDARQPARVDLQVDRSSRARSRSAPSKSQCMQCSDRARRGWLADWLCILILQKALRFNNTNTKRKIALRIFVFCFIFFHMYSGLRLAQCEEHVYKKRKEVLGKLSLSSSSRFVLRI